MKKLRTQDRQIFRRKGKRKVRFAVSRIGFAALAFYLTLLPPSAHSQNNQVPQSTSDSTCRVPQCGTVASVVKTCVCGDATYLRPTTPGKEVAPTYCCETSKKSKFFLSKTPCPASLLKQKNLKNTFCDPTELWVKGRKKPKPKRLIMLYGLTPSLVLKVHPALVAPLDKIRDQLKPYHEILRKDDTAAFSIRPIKGSPSDTKLYSTHAYGIAIDFNWNSNPYCPVFPDTGKCKGCDSALETDLPPKLIEIFESAGFEWGGRWKIPDPMHFELKESAWPKVTCQYWKDQKGPRYKWLF